MLLSGRKYFPTGDDLLLAWKYYVRFLKDFAFQQVKCR